MNTDIRLDKGWLRHLPRWTHACKQLRLEAIPLWLTTNLFTFKLYSHGDLDVLLAIEADCAKRVKTEKMDVTITFHEELHPDAGFARRWARRVHAGSNWISITGPSDTVTVLTLALTRSMVQMALLCRSLPLAKCEKVLEASRKAMVQMLEFVLEEPNANA